MFDDRLTGEPPSRIHYACNGIRINDIEFTCIPGLKIRWAADDQATHLVRPIKKPYTQTRVRWYAELCLRLVEGRERCGGLKVGLVLRSLVTHVAARKKPHTLKHTSAACLDVYG